MIALILAAGYATRLLPLTESTPKPLLSIKGKPIIEYITDKLINIQGIEKIFLVTNHKFQPKFLDWQNKLNTRYQRLLEIIDDGTTSIEQRLGAIGDINFVIKNKYVDSDLLVIAGDNLFNFNLEDFIKFGQEKKSAASIGLFDVRDKNLARRYGLVSLDSAGKIAEFQEKPKIAHSTLASMCLYYFPKDSLKFVFEYTRSAKFIDAPGNYIQWLSKKIDVYGYVVTGLWFDVGDILSYSKAIWKFK